MYKYAPISIHLNKQESAFSFIPFLDILINRKLHRLQMSFWKKFQVKHTHGKLVIFAGGQGCLKEKFPKNFEFFKNELQDFSKKLNLVSLDTSSTGVTSHNSIIITD